MRIPEFKLKDQTSSDFSSSDLLGQWTLIYFYPKDGTPVCIKEACNFRDGQKELEHAGLRIVGISADSPSSHANFAERHNLSFTLLSDPNREVLKAFGSVDENEYLGVSRDSYLISPNGEAVKKYTKINPDTHYQEIIADFKRLKSR